MGEGQDHLNPSRRIRHPVNDPASPTEGRGTDANPTKSPLCRSQISRMALSDFGPGWHNPASHRRIAVIAS